MKRALLLLLAFVTLCAVLWAAQVNGYFDFFQITAPGNPPSGQTRVYVDGTQKILYDKTDGGLLHHMVATSSCSGGTPVVGNINIDGTVTCAASGGGGNTTTVGTCITYPPSTAGHSTGDVYKCSDSEYVLYFDGSVWQPSTDGVMVTRPDISTFTNFGSAPDASDNTRGPYWMRFKNGGAGYKWVLWTKAKPGATFTVTLGFMNLPDKWTGDQIYVCIVLRKTSTGQFWANGFGDDELSQAVIFFTNPTTFGGSNPLSQRNDHYHWNRISYARVVDDGTNWTYYVGLGGAVDPRSTSNTNWLQVFQQAHNTTITPDEVGFGMSTHVDTAVTQSAEIVHFSATSP
jgi:hypothetical protein